MEILRKILSDFPKYWMAELKLNYLIKEVVQ